MPDTAIRIIGIAGSLRAGSFNRALLKAASSVAPDGMELSIFDIGSIPLFNQDLDNDRDRPVAVETLKTAVHGSDGVLIATPEYSHSMPGVLKNTLDWLARPGQGLGRPMSSKPTGIIGAAPGGSGSMRAQEQLKLTLMAMLALVYPNRGVAVSRAGDKFDGEMKLVDERTIEFLRKYLSGFADWVGGSSKVGLPAAAKLSRNPKQPVV